MTDDNQGRDGTQAFLDSLPEIKPGESFRFACHPGVTCFNACCADLNLMLTPYDVLRLRRSLNLASEPFIIQHAEVGMYPDTGFPALHLKMNEDEAKACPFVTPAGCSVYRDRPGACRTYPVGRAARLDKQGNILEQHFLVREEHCRGFEQDARWTTETWQQDQEIALYNRANDRYMRIMARQKGKPAIDAKHGVMCLLALYQLDRFQEFIRNMNLFSRLDADQARQEAVLSDEEQCLDFAYDWVELMVCGDNANLTPR